jgi:hypothetical protein
MLLDLIILIIRLATKDSDSSSSAPAKRKVQAGHVTLECPFCHTLGVAPQFNLEYRTSSGWQRHMETYECPTCNHSMNAETMHNDGTGVLVAKTWNCPACHSPNPATQFVCSSCGTHLR